MTSMTFQNSFW